MLHDLKHALRVLARAPGFALVVTITLAVGIGANTAIFSVVRGVLLRPLPYREPENLVRVFGRWHQYPTGSVSVPEFVDYAAQARSIASLAAYNTGNANLADDSGPPDRVTAAIASATFLPLLGVATEHGRWFTADEDEAGHEHVMVLSHGSWQRRFGGARDVVGKTVRLDNEAYTIVGILPASFSFPGDVEVWVPYAWAPVDRAEDRRGAHNLRVLARLAPGVTLARAQADFDLLGERLRAAHPQSYPADGGWNPLLVPFHDQIVGEVRLGLWLLIGAAGLVLLIACANVANLLLARVMARAREMSVRAALGARRGHLVRQLLTESLLLSIIGGALGVVLALWGVDVLIALSPDSLPRAGEIRVDGGVLAFSVAVTAATGVLFGLLPALHGSRVDLGEALRAGGRSATSGRPKRLRRLLVVGEVAVAVVVVTAAGLVTRSFARVVRVDPGFPTGNLLTLQVTLPAPNGFSSKADQARFARYFGQAGERLARLPGVVAAGAMSRLPFRDEGADWTFSIEDFPTPPGQMKPDHEFRTVTPGALEALGVPLLRGRLIARDDRLDTQPVVVINQALARKYWHDADPVGRRIMLEDEEDKHWTTIVGVVGDIHELGLDAEIRPTMYYPESQLRYEEKMGLLVRSAIPEDKLAAMARAELEALDPQQPIYDVRPMVERMGQSLERRRFVLVLFELFAGLALLLATVGLYGVMSYTVAQRTREIGVRIALGARGKNVMGLVAREGVTMIGAGVALGIVGAIAVTRVLGGMLFEVSPTDPVALAIAALLLAVVSVVATLVPVRRALRVDPMVVLRDE